MAAIKAGTGLLVLSGLALVALASSPAQAKAPKLSRGECIHKWADHLARKLDGERDPQKLRAFAAIAHAAGWPSAGACLDARADELEQFEAWAVLQSCYPVLYPILVDDFSNIEDPRVALEIAKQAEQDGLRDVEACFIAYAHALG